MDSLLIEKKVSCSKYFEHLEMKYKPISGVFERWGDHVIHEDGKTFQRTVAIVLGEDKKVYMAPPDSITVID